VSALSDALAALRDALKLADEVKRAGQTLERLAGEVRDQDRRITRLEAQWETALALRERPGTGRARLPRKTD
jgi:hypothetical protein